MGSRFRAASIALFVGGALLVSHAPTAQAATVIVVNLDGDVTDPVDGKCSLREAITSANKNRPSGGKRGECVAGSRRGTDKIKIRVGGFPFLNFPIASSTNEDANVDGDLDVQSKIRILGGNDYTDVLIDGSSLDRVFDIRPGGSLTMSKVSVTGGLAPAGTDAIVNIPATPGENGGGIRVNTGAKLTLIDSDLDSNQAGDGGAGASGGSAADAMGEAGGNGGGIYNQGTTSILRSRIHNGSSGDGRGGATDNTTTGEAAGAGGAGGGIFNENGATLTITLSKVDLNSTGNGGVGGNGPGSANGGNGAQGGNGGGVGGTGTILIDRSLVENNSTGSGGNGGDSIGGVGGNGADGGAGGGIFSSGTLTLLASTVSDNTTGVKGTSGAFFGTDGNGGSGGGLAYNNVGGTLELRNVTVAANAASGDAGGMHIADGTATINNVTLDSNTAIGQGGGLVRSGGATVNISNSFLTRNLHQNAANANDCRGTITSLGHNMTTNKDTCTLGGSDLDLVTPQLGPVQDNGGPFVSVFFGTPTLTMALDPLSDGIDDGNPLSSGTGLCEKRDERGAVRPAGACDVGAYELVRCGNTIANVIGTEGRDNLFGTGVTDGILAYGGNDRVDGDSGDDEICGGTGNDRLTGGDDDDNLFGEKGDDVLDGADGLLDHCDGGPGADRLRNCEV